MYVATNINNLVKITLTPDGLAHLKSYWRDLWPGAERAIPHLDGLEWRTQIWELMAIFGPQMYMSNNKTMFENNQIHIDMGAD